MSTSHGKQHTCVTDVQHYLFSGKQCVDVFHSIEICSIQGVLAGENLQNKNAG